MCATEPFTSYILGQLEHVRPDYMKLYNISLGYARVVLLERSLLEVPKHALFVCNTI